ncbi:hypothetical protein KW803_00535 [Candidatus Saccharibacteria bacterium]|nr:hypothetical protein [Candidatus Saccharibacteria bacterium]
MKRLCFVAIALALLLMLSSARQVLAHTEDKDGKISALLHIDPNDIARPGKENTIHVYFNDEDNRFTVEGCFCKVKITEAGKTISETVLRSAGSKIGAAGVYIPSDNTSYGVVVIGTPKTGGFFQPFRLNFDIDVGKPTLATESQKSNFGVYIIAGAGLIITAAIGYWLIRRHNLGEPSS